MNIETHPCFSGCCTDYARIHLPVAPKCNMQCNYCVRKFSCANENRPGVTIKVMEPAEALAWYVKMKSAIKNLTVVGIAGPGDSLANWKKTKQTIQLIREYDKEVQFCLSTNGLLLPKYIDELIKNGVEFVTVTVNAIDALIGAKIYSYILFNGERMEGVKAAEFLWSRQKEGIEKLIKAGICVKINTVAIPGVNMEEIPNIAKIVGKLGCEVQNIIPLLPVDGAVFDNLVEPKYDEILALRNECKSYIRQMEHCTRCRADAVGSLKCHSV